MSLLSRFGPETFIPKAKTFYRDDVTMALRKFLFQRLVVASAVLWLGGCATGPMPAELAEAPSPHLSPGAPAKLTDSRAEFRRYFCVALAERQPGSPTVGCDTWLHRLADEPNPTAAGPPAQPAALDVLLVTGAFSGCFGEHARPFNSAVEQLANGPHRLRTVVVGGRSSVAHNAAQIAAYLEEHPAEAGRRLVMIGYSKGTTDILRFLADYPAQAAAVDAVVSVAGAVYGSPLADLFDGPYHLLFSHLPMNDCGHGDGGVVHSLRTDVRRAWLEDTTLPAQVRYYSLAAFTTRDRLARALVPTWELLLDHDEWNDGQLLPTDALIPGSAVLGYLNADHWAVAMEIEQELEFWAHRKFAPTFPHTALLSAILEHVGLDLAQRGATNPGSILQSE